MRVFRAEGAFGAEKVLVAEIPDCALVLGIGATVGEDGRDHEPIIAVDYERRVYWRDGGAELPFPDRVLAADAISWSDLDGCDEEVR